MKKILMLVTSLLISCAAFAEEGQELTTIHGTNIDMKIYDHAMAGAIKDYVAWGFFDEAAGVAELIVRKYELTIKTIFTKQENGKVGGTIVHTKDGVEYKTQIEFAGIDSANKIIKLKINDELVSVHVVPESMNESHMVNPTFTAVVAGETISYQMGGEGCYGKSMFFAMMILGAYIH
ncbi:MAG: hypothetical protein A2381_04040 [Bdellovibrionales bacterium RIFOXYB1_FULL_37_110]|nr:MAG: hypothetical protein A2417_10150 [Bdellovibrionales bacterium RIFOXYC1_FULL_37_79]OFZ59093.1 MAG: hypothetical protein A2381_04040 [Bdellovibrionales bacterium RIFOXYB1_FULL_37_110]OFZ64100.1 MAG: hypothetical protein A2577_15160 [Bdellovibrionales bacterium RIFOXYD1_FULL_36_51]